MFHDDDAAPVKHGVAALTLLNDSLARGALFRVLANPCRQRRILIALQNDTPATKMHCKTEMQHDFKESAPFSACKPLVPRAVVREARLEAASTGHDRGVVASFRRRHFAAAYAMRPK